MITGPGIDIAEYDHICDLSYLGRVLVADSLPLVRPRFESQFPDNPSQGVYAGVFDLFNQSSETSIKNLFVIRSSPNGVSEMLYGDCSTPQGFGEVYQRDHTNCVWGPINEVGFKIVRLGKGTLKKWSLSLAGRYDLHSPVIEERNDSWASFHFYDKKDFGKLEEIMKRERFTFVKSH